MIRFSAGLFFILAVLWWAGRLLIFTRECTIERRYPAVAAISVTPRDVRRKLSSLARAGALPRASFQFHARHADCIRSSMGKASSPEEHHAYRADVV
jgi:hypothetical protein